MGDNNHVGGGADIIRPDFTTKRDPREHQLIRRARHNEDGHLCSHKYVYINENRRTVMCRDKRRHAELDPFEVLASVARHWDAATYQERHVEAARKTVESLKREERRIKDQIRRAKPGQIGLPKQWCFRCLRQTTHDGSTCIACDKAFNG